MVETMSDGNLIVKRIERVADQLPMVIVQWLPPDFTCTSVITGLNEDDGLAEYRTSIINLKRVRRRRKRMRKSKNNENNLP